MSTPLRAAEKKDICRAFVIDVLSNRVKAWHEDEVKAMAERLGAVFTPELLKQVETLHTIIDSYKDAEDVFRLFDIELTRYGQSQKKKKMITELKYEFTLTFYLGDGYISHRDFGLPKASTVKLPIPIPEVVGTNDWEWTVREELMDGKVFGELDIEQKLEKDARRLFEKAYESLKNIRTYEGLEKNVPELIPYTKVNKDAASGLADLASCMRVKDDC